MADSVETQQSATFIPQITYPMSLRLCVVAGFAKFPLQSTQQ
jgi:hypothetical protein